MKNLNPKNHGDKLLFVLALAVLLTAMLGIRSGKPVPVKEIAGLVFTQWYDDDSWIDTLRILINEFESANEDVKVVLNNKPYEDLRRELFDADEAPAAGDILALDCLWVPELLGLGIIENYQTESEQAVSQVPLFSHVNVFYYNIELLKEAGFSRPPKNRTEFLACLRALAEKSKGPEGTGCQGLAFAGNSTRWLYDDIFPWIWAAGAELVKDGKPAVSSRQVIDTLSFFSLLHREGFVIPDAFSADIEKKLEDFIYGRAAFMIAGSGHIGQIRERMGAEAFGVSSVPVPDNYAGKNYFGSAGWTIGINSASANKNEARLFADFLAGKAALLSDISTSPTDEVSRVPHHSKVSDIVIAGESSEDFSGLPWTKLENIFREELNVLFAGKATPAETAAAIQKRWEGVMAGMKL